MTIGQKQENASTLKEETITEAIIEEFGSYVDITNDIF